MLSSMAQADVSWVFHQDSSLKARHLHSEAYPTRLDVQCKARPPVAAVMLFSQHFAQEIEPSHQLLFTTHSPFMVPAERLDTVRIVEDRVTSPKPGKWVAEGTSVRSDSLAVDRDTLFPLQGALGYEITQSLFIGKNTLLVEGPGDILFLKALSSALERRKRPGLAPKWTLCPAGGLDKVQPFVSLFSGARLNLAVLTDFAKADQRKIDNLRKTNILEDARILTFASLLGQITYGYTG